MAFYSGQVFPAQPINQSTNQPVEQVEQHKPIDQTDQLNKLELEYLLSTLKNIDLKGYQIEMFYNLALKLQNQYLKKSK